MKSSFEFEFDLKTLIISSFFFTLIDAVYLYSTKKYFNKVIKSIQGKEITLKYSGIVLCYFSLILGLNYFILSNKNLKNDQKIKNAFILGFVIYAVFESTTYAIFDNWTTTAVIMDSIWGGILFSLTTFVSLKFLKN